MSKVDNENWHNTIDEINERRMATLSELTGDEWILAANKFEAELLLLIAERDEWLTKSLGISRWKN